MANRSNMTECIDRLFKLSTDRLGELEENVHLSRAYHDGRTTAALRSLKKHRYMHVLIQQLCSEIHSMEGDEYASD